MNSLATHHTHALARLLRPIGEVRRADVIESGWSHDNFCVMVGDARFFAKLYRCAGRRSSAPREADILEALGLGLGPTVQIASEAGFVAEFVDGYTPTAWDFVENKQVSSFVFGALLTLQARPSMGLTFDPLAQIELRLEAASAVEPRFLELVARLRAPSDIHAPAYQASAHNDFNGGNFIMSQARSVIVDWEFFGANHRLYDLAKLCSHYWLSNRQCADVFNKFCAHVQRVYPATHFPYMLALADAWQAAWLLTQEERAGVDLAARGRARVRQLRQRLGGG